MATSYDETRVQLRGHLRFAVIAWAIALPFMYALMIWLKISGGVPNGNWLFVALFPIGSAASVLGGMCLASRSTLSRIRAEEQAAAERTTGNSPH